MFNFMGYLRKKKIVLKIDDTKKFIKCLSKKSFKRENFRKLFKLIVIITNKLLQFSKKK